MPMDLFIYFIRCNVIQFTIRISLLDAIFSYKIYILSLLLLVPCNDLIRSMEGKVLNENQITPGYTLVSMLLPEEIGFAP